MQKAAVTQSVFNSNVDFLAFPSIGVEWCWVVISKLMINVLIFMKAAKIPDLA